MLLQNNHNSKQKWQVVKGKMQGLFRTPTYQQSRDIPTDRNTLRSRFQDCTLNVLQNIADMTRLKLSNYGVRDPVVDKFLELINIMTSVAKTLSIDDNFVKNLFKKSLSFIVSGFEEFVGNEQETKVQMKDPIKNWLTKILRHAILERRLGKELNTEDLKDFFNGLSPPSQMEVIHYSIGFY